MELLYLLRCICTLLVFGIVDAKGKEDLIGSITNKTPKDVKIPKGTARGPLGQGFFLHKMDLLSKQLQATGTEIFQDLSYEKCVIRDKTGTTQEDSTFFKSTESLYQSVGTETKVDASLKGTYTLGASVSAVTNNIVSGNSEVSGLSLVLTARSAIEGMKKECINNQQLSKQFMSDFERLPSAIKNPAHRDSWRTYEVFLDKYGSHIAKEIILGSSINQYVFAKSSEKFSQREFTVKACVSLAGPSEAGEVGLSACTGISKEEISTSSKLEVVQKLVVRGGTAEKRATLTGDLSRDQIKTFLIEGQTDPSPILYTFYPLWKILQDRYLGTKSFAKAINLEQYYKGYLEFGCSYKKTKNGFTMQEFALNKNSEPSAPTYGCYLTPQGCHSNSDCHYQAGIWCSCNGDSCIRYQDKSNNDGTSRKVAYAQYPKWAWQGCRLAVFMCFCRNTNHWEQVWTGETIDDPIIDINTKMTRKHHIFRPHKRVSGPTE